MGSYVTHITYTPPVTATGNSSLVNQVNTPNYVDINLLPTVVSYMPSMEYPAMVLNPDIEITFNRAMSVGTLVADSDLNGATVLVNQYMMLSEVATETTHQLDVTDYDIYTNTLTVKPQTNLSANTSYAMIVLAGMPDTVGRKTTRNVSWMFSTSTSVLETPSLISPVNMGVFPLAPVCTWASATTGVTFEYQISSTPAFTSISYSTSAVTGLTVGPLTSEQLPDNHTYYWRIRATSGTLNSNWSEIYAFRIEPPASAPVVRTLPTFDRFAVVGHLPRVGKGNFTTWPTCLVTFNTDIYAPSVSGGVVFNAVDVDTGATVTLPTSALVVSGTTLTLSVTGDIAYNTRYITTIDEVMSSAGAILSEPVEISFTGPYLPMYVDATTLLSNNGEFGAFFARYTQEEINLQLHRASLKCNRLIDGDSTTPLSTLRATKTATYAMLEYVSALTCYTLIQDFQYKLLMDSDRKMQIDTLIDNLGTDILKQISAILAKLKGDIDTYAMSIAGTIVKPVAGVQSSQWDPAEMENDASVSNILKGNF